MVLINSIIYRNAPQICIVDVFIAVARGIVFSVPLFILVNVISQECLEGIYSNLTQKIHIDSRLNSLDSGGHCDLTKQVFGHNSRIHVPIMTMTLGHYSSP